MKVYHRLIQIFFAVSCIFAICCMFPNYITIDYSTSATTLYGIKINPGDLAEYNQTFKATSYYRFWPIIGTSLAAMYFCLFKYKRIATTVLGLILGVELFWMVFSVYFLQDSLIIEGGALASMFGSEFSKFFSDIVKTATIKPGPAAYMAMFACVAVVVSTLLCFALIPKDAQ